MVKYQVEKLSSDEFEAIVKSGNVLAVVPVGVLEAHGVHLPLATDTLQATHLVELFAAEADWDVIIYPAINYGVCTSTRNFPGSLSLRFETLKAIISDIIGEIYRNGINRIIIYSGHAGRLHLSALRYAGYEAIERLPELKLMILSDYELVAELKGKKFDAHDGHAGTAETARLLVIDKTIVNKDKLPVRSFDRPPKFQLLRNPENYFPSGVIGDPRTASVQLGIEIDNYVVKRLIEEINKWLKKD